MLSPNQLVTQVCEILDGYRPEIPWEKQIKYSTRNLESQDQATIFELVVGVTRRRKELRELVRCIYEWYRNEIPRDERALYQVLTYMFFFRWTSLSVGSKIGYLLHSTEDPIRIQRLAKLFLAAPGSTERSWISEQLKINLDAHFVEKRLDELHAQALSSQGRRMIEVLDSACVIPAADQVTECNPNRMRRIPTKSESAVADQAPCRIKTPEYAIHEVIPHQSKIHMTREPKISVRNRNFIAPSKKMRMKKSLSSPSLRKGKCEKDHAKKKKIKQFVEGEEPVIRTTKSFILKQASDIRRSVFEQRDLIMKYENDRHDELELQRWKANEESKEKENQAAIAQERISKIKAGLKHAQANKKRCIEDNASKAASVRERRQILLNRSRRLKEEEEKEKKILVDSRKVKNPEVQKEFEKRQRRIQEIAQEIRVQSVIDKQKKKEELERDAKEKRDYIMHLRSDCHLAAIRNETRKIADTTTSGGHMLLVEKPELETKHLLQLKRLQDVESVYRKREAILDKSVKQSADLIKAARLIELRRKQLAVSKWERRVEKKRIRNLEKEKFQNNEDSLALESFTHRQAHITQQIELRKRQIRLEKLEKLRAEFLNNDHFAVQMRNMESTQKAGRRMALTAQKHRIASEKKSQLASIKIHRQRAKVREEKKINKLERLQEINERFTVLDVEAKDVQSVFENTQVKLIEKRKQIIEQAKYNRDA